MPFRNSLLGAAYAAFLFVTAVQAVPSAPVAAPQIASRETRTVVFDDPINGVSRISSVDGAMSAQSVPVSLDDQMIGLGFKLLSADKVGEVERRIWGKSTTSKRNDAPVKREVMNIEGGQCDTQCGFADSAKANTEDCKTTYQALYNKATAFTLDPHVVVTAKYNACAAFFVNNSDKTLTYDHWDMGGTAQWLNGNCLIQQAATVGVCRYAKVGSGYADGAYTSVNNPNYYTPPTGA